MSAHALEEGVEDRQVRLRVADQFAPMASKSLLEAETIFEHCTNR